MQKTPGGGTNYIVPVVQAIVLLLVGYLFSELAESIDIPGPVLLGGLGILLVLAVLTIIAQVRQQSGQEVIPRTVIDAVREGTVQHVGTMFPFSVIVGAISGFLWSSAFPGTSYTYMQAHDYEVISYIVGVAFLLALSTRGRSLSLMITAALGYSLGSSSAMLIYDPVGNDLRDTYLYTGSVFLLTALLVKSPPVRSFIQRIRNQL